jgi:predicted Zn-dependent peptidase
MVKKITLKNGLRIITLPQQSTEAVTILILVGTGSKYETKEISGISHFLEHMFFKGTKKRPDKLKIAETLDKIGGLYNAFTGEDYTGYFAKVAFAQFDTALDWVSDIFLNSTLPEKEVAREKRVIIEEINMIYDNPMSRVVLLWNKLLYGDQPAGWDIAGTKESITASSRQDLVNYMKTQYVASNTIVCVAGKIEDSAAIKKVKKCFSKISIAQPKGKSKVVEKQNCPQSLLAFRETDQTHLCLGTRGYDLFHPQRYAQEVLGVILGGMMSSRLFMEIRENLGLAYYIKTSVDANPDTGFLVTQVGVDNKKAQKAIAAILKEYKKISNKRIPSAELKKAKNYIKGKMALLLEPSDVLASFYGLQELLEGGILTQKEIYAKISKVSAGEVQSVAKDIFRPEKLNLALVGPFKEKKTFQKILKL